MSKLLSVLEGRAHAGEGLCDGPVEVVVVGAGGSGSHLVPMLAVLSQSLLDWGHPGGLTLTLVDDDVVGPANVGRSRYFAPDIGAGKAATLITRVNLCYGTTWQAVTARVGDGEPLDCIRRARIVIGCVDTRRARRAIHEAVSHSAGRWGSRVWLDLGNGAFDGQVILGEVGHIVGRDRLPHVLDLYPEMADPSLDPADSGPSCSRV
jgi:PRTRC genetic system ThiF family protein